MRRAMPPILLIVFNRPEKTRAVLDTFRAARPTRLYVAADGPRDTHSDDVALCETTRAIAAEIDWKCEVKTLFRNENLGCRLAVSGAIDWFFEHEPEGIILEDDILVDFSFFSFATEMLERYRDDERVMSIGASNPLQEVTPTADPQASYLFSTYAMIWGWATWRRAWKNYDHTLETIASSASIRAMRKAAVPGLDFVGHWLHKLRRVRNGTIDTWDFSLSYSQMRAGAFCVVPRMNLMKNIGFDAEATHTTSPDDTGAKLIARQLPPDLQHPTVVVRDLGFDRQISSQIYQMQPLSFRRQLRWFLRSL